jgi:hypothetical protein
MITVSAVPNEHLATCWPHVETYLDGAAKRTYGRVKVTDIYNSIEEQGYQLWVAFDESNKIKGAVVTEICNYPQRRVLSMTYCGGENLVEWKDPMLDLLRRYAADVGCDAIEAVARKGWAKVFKNDGYKDRWVTFELPLQGAQNG